MSDPESARLTEFTVTQVEVLAAGADGGARASGPRRCRGRVGPDHTCQGDEAANDDSDERVYGACRRGTPWQARLVERDSD